MSLTLLFITSLLTKVHAAAVYRNERVGDTSYLEHQRRGNASSAAEKCKVPESDPQIWTKTNTSVWFESWLRQHGTVDWIHQMDLKTMTDGNQGTSNLYCDQFPETAGCDYPAKNICPEYSPPEFFFVQTSAAALYHYHLYLRTRIKDTIDDASLRLDDIMNDFTPPAHTSWGFWGFLTAILQTASIPMSYAAPAQGAAANAAWAIVYAARAVDMEESGPQPQFPEKDLKISLANIWEAEQSRLDDKVRSIFKGKGVPRVHMDVPEPGPDAAGNDYMHLLQLFTDGRWHIAKGEIASMGDRVADKFGRLLRQSLVAQALKANNYAVLSAGTKFSDNAEPCDAGNKAFVRLELDGFPYCLGIGKEPSGRTVSSKALPDDKVALLSEKYGINLADLVRNAVECSGGRGILVTHMEDTPGNLDPTTLNDQGLPKCLFNFDVRMGRV